MRIAYVTEKAGLGGGETSLLNLIKDFHYMGDTVALLCPNGSLSARAQEAGCPVFESAFPDVHLIANVLPTVSLTALLHITRSLARFRPDVIHCESLLALYYAGLAGFLLRTRVVATYHGYWPWQKKQLRLFARWFCAELYPVSRAVGQELDRAGYQGKLPEVPLTLSPDFLVDLPSRKDAREVCGLPADKEVVMQVARFEAIKGQKNLLGALGIARRKRPDLFAVFCGGVMEPASDEVLRYRAEVEVIAREQLKGNVVFLGHRNDVPILMRAADVVVTPSEFESFSMTTIEAMAVGTPVIATASGGPTEILTDGVTGLLVPPRNPRLLAEAVSSVMEDPVGADCRASRARELVLREYGPMVRAKKMLARYQSLLDRRAS